MASVGLLGIGVEGSARDCKNQMTGVQIRDVSLTCLQFGVEAVLTLPFPLVPREL